MKVFFSLLGLVLIGVIAYLAYQYRADFGLGGKGGGPGGANQTNWETVDRSSDGFTVEMPAAATETQIPAYNVDGGAEQVPMIEATLDPATTYAVAWADNPPVEQAAGEDAEKTLDMARDGALGRTQTSLIGESKSDRDGYKVRDFLARNAGGGILNGRLILTGTHLYMLMATFPSVSARHQDDVDRFFDSFKLTAVHQQ